MNAPHEEAAEFAKQSKRENRVYVGNLSYDVKYRDLMEFMRGGGWGNNLRLTCCFSIAFSSGVGLELGRGSVSDVDFESSLEARGCLLEPWSCEGGVGFSWFIDGVAS